MTTIKMSQTRKGSNDGLTVEQFYKGEEYDVSPTLANEFIDKEYATISVYNCIADSIGILRRKKGNFVMRIWDIQLIANRILDGDLKATQKDELTKLLLNNSEKHR